MSTRTRRLGLVAAALIALTGLTVDLGGYPLLDPDEGRNAEVAREMAVERDYVLPRLNGLPYVDKPALFFAATAVSVDVLGATETAARLPALAFTLLTLGVVAWYGRRLFGGDAGWIAAVATATTPFTLAYARTVILDSALTLWVVLSIVGFHQAVEAPQRRTAHSAARTGAHPAADRGARWRALAWGAMALGVLTKGPIAVALPVLIVLPYALWRRRARRLIDPVGPLLFVALILPWLFAMSNRVPGFFQYAVVTETIGRVTSDELGRSGPLWYFLAILPAAALPWSVVAAAGWWRARRSTVLRAPPFVFLALWIAVPLLFFTLSQSKRPQYVLPLVPAFGLMVGALWSRLEPRAIGARPAAVVLALLGGFLMLVRSHIAAWVPATPDVAAAIPRTAVVLGAVCLVAAGITWLAAPRRTLALLALTLPVAAIPLASRGLMDAIGDDRSSAALAEAIAPVLSPASRVIGVEAFPLSLPFYLDRVIVLSSRDAAELTSNYLVRHPEVWQAPDSPLRDVAWWRTAAIECARPSVFVVEQGHDAAHRWLADRLPLLGASRKYAAYGPCGRTALASDARSRVGGSLTPAT